MIGCVDFSSFGPCLHDETHSTDSFIVHTIGTKKTSVMQCNIVREVDIALGATVLGVFEMRKFATWRWWKGCFARRMTELGENIRHGIDMLACDYWQAVRIEVAIADIYCILLVLLPLRSISAKAVQN